jgi:hypothetical protein
MTTEYRYRKHIRRMQVISPIVDCLIVVVVWILWTALHWAFPSGADDPNLAPVVRAVFWVNVVISCVILASAVGGWYFFRRLAGIRVALDDSALVYRYRGGEKRLPFDDRISLRFSFIPWVGGWLVVRSGDYTVRLTIALEGISSLLRELKAALDIRGLSDSYDSRRLFKFFKLATLADQSWERFSAEFWKACAGIFAGGVLGLMISVALGGDVVEIIAWTGASLLWPLIVWIIPELIFLRRLAKCADEESFTCAPRDLGWEKKICRRTIAWGLALYLLAAGGGAVASLTFLAPPADGAYVGWTEDEIIHEWGEPFQKWKGHYGNVPTHVAETHDGVISMAFVFTRQAAVGFAFAPRGSPAAPTSRPNR